MTREELKSEIFETINEDTSIHFASAATNYIMKKIDEYVRSRRRRAHIKNKGRGGVVDESKK